MGQHGPPLTSPLSAAVPLVAWIAAHGRWPKIRECCPSQGLCCWTTYYKVFGVESLSGIMEQAFLVVEQARVTRLKPCLGCRTAIRDEGAHIRFCGACRRKQNKREEQAAMDEPALSYVQLKRYGYGQADWDDDIAWG